MAPLSWLLLGATGLLAQAATVTYDFNVTWVTRNPDDKKDRPVMGINNQWPIPTINVNVGDQLIVHVHNQLGNQSTGLHWHGLFQRNSTHMDGAVGVTQCPISPGQSLTYDFMITQPGTYWYHSHVPGQYPDGLRGPLIVHDPESPYKDKYDEELILTVSDWYHDEMPGLIKWFMGVTNPTGAEPVPNNALMNETQNFTLPVQPSKTYLFRMINIGAFAAQYFWIEGHKMRIVEVDGIYTEESAETDMIYLTAAQRCSFLLTTKDDASTNFAMVGSMDQDFFDAVPPELNVNVTGWLVYDDKAEKPEPAMLDAFEPFDDHTLVPYDKVDLFQDVAKNITLDFKMDNLGDGANYAFFNDITWIRPNIPTLYSALSTGEHAMDPVIYGPNTNAFILEKGQVVEIVVNNLDPGKHPFHLHGHAFQAVVRSQDEAGPYVYNETFPETPMRRDTFMVRPNGNIVLRFKADNPDNARIWLFHCHIEWHMVSGLIMTLVEAPAELQSSGLTIPQDHIDSCRDQNIATAGNAVGNTEDVYDLKGVNRSVPPLPAGFTARGIVALVFSILAAFLGLATIAWYGAGDIGKQEPGRRMGGLVKEVSN